MKNKPVKRYEKRRGLALSLAAWLAAISLFACIGFLSLKVKGEQDRLRRASRQIHAEIERYATDIAARDAEVENRSSRTNLERMLIAQESQLIAVPPSRMGVLGEPEVPSGRVAQNRNETGGAGGQ